MVASLGHLAMDHASLSRRSTVPTSNRDISNLWALSTFLPYTSICYFFFFILPLCSLVVCCHHPSPRITIVFALLSNESNLSTPLAPIFLISSYNKFRSSLYSPHSPTAAWVLLSPAFPQGQLCMPSSSSTPLLVCFFSSFWQVQVSYTIKGGGEPQALSRWKQGEEGVETRGRCSRKIHIHMDIGGTYRQRYIPVDPRTNHIHPPLIPQADTPSTPGTPNNREKR